MDCLFCKIAHKEIPADIVYEDEKIMAFLDIHPLASGHTMIIPKVHAENILDLANEMIDPLFGAVKKVTNVLNTVFNPQGFTIGINHGKVSGQVIDHLHVHVIPRFEGDGGSSLHAVVSNCPKESIQEIKNKILAYYIDGNNS